MGGAPHGRSATRAIASRLSPSSVSMRLRLAVPPPETLPAENPLVRAENNLGYLHDRGENGPRNVAEARKWYTRAANAGLAEAQFNLAVLLLLNPEPNLDRTEVERWLVSAARQGVTPARRTLAFLYFGNHGFIGLCCISVCKIHVPEREGVST